MQETGIQDFWLLFQKLPKMELFGAITHFSPHLESEFKLLCTNVHTSSCIWEGRTVDGAELASDQGSVD